MLLLQEGVAGWSQDEFLGAFQTFSKSLWLSAWEEQTTEKAHTGQDQGQDQDQDQDQDQGQDQRQDQGQGQSNDQPKWGTKEYVLARRRQLKLALQEGYDASEQILGRIECWLIEKWLHINVLQYIFEHLWWLFFLSLWFFSTLIVNRSSDFLKIIMFFASPFSWLKSQLPKDWKHRCLSWLKHSISMTTSKSVKTPLQPKPIQQERWRQECDVKWWWVQTAGRRIKYVLAFLVIAFESGINRYCQYGLIPVVAFVLAVYEWFLYYREVPKGMSRTATNRFKDIENRDRRYDFWLAHGYYNWIDLFHIPMRVHVVMFIAWQVGQRIAMWPFNSLWVSDSASMTWKLVCWHSVEIALLCMVAFMESEYDRSRRGKKRKYFSLEVIQTWVGWYLLFLYTPYAGETSFLFDKEYPEYKNRISYQQTCKAMHPDIFCRPEEHETKTVKRSTGWWCRRCAAVQSVFVVVLVLVQCCSAT